MPAARRDEPPGRAPASNLTQQLWTLQEVTQRLATVETTDELCRQAVELGRSLLKFDRLSIWFIDEARMLMLGSFGTDEQGNLRDERESSVPLRPEGLAWQVFSRRESMACTVQTPLADHQGRTVGEGQIAMGTLWDGDAVIGIVSVDNLLRREPIGDDQQEILRLYASTLGHLITRRRAEEALHGRDALLRTFLDHATDAFFFHGNDGIILDVNRQACEVLGYSREELIGAHPTDFDPDLTREKAAQITAQLDTGTPLTFETRHRRKDGTIFPVEVHLRAFRHEGRRYGVSLAHDITARKRAEDEIRQLNAQLEERVRDRTRALEAANRELEAFTYSVSHDLRTPLRSIDGFSRVLLEDYASKLDDEGRDNLQRVRAASQRMGLLIDDLLELSRTSRAELRLSSLDLSKLAQEIAAELARAEPERRVDCLIAPGLAAQADPALLRVVLQNLLTNAWKFTGRRPHARIEVGRTGPNAGAAFFVRDNGAGFDPTYAARLFGPFQRLHSAHEFPGTGVGLATVQRIIHRHGGRVWAEGAVDHGATFYFTLPTQQPETAP